MLLPGILTQWHLGGGLQNGNAEFKTHGLPYIFGIYFHLILLFQTMFHNTFQSGLLSVMYSLGSAPLQLWDKKARNGHIKRITDEEIQVTYKVKF
jgi:hypothetical protein